jgi:hypothetical protein
MVDAGAMSDPQHIVAVSGLFYNSDGQVLLVKTERRGWECPGGQVYMSADAGDNWMPIAEHLPRLLSVEVQTLT